MESWKQQGIPLHIVLRAIERAFDSFEARPRKRSVKTLLYCQEEVDAQFAEWLESRVGASDVPEVAAEQKQTHFSTAAIHQHLKQNKSLLEQAAINRRLAADEELAETLRRAVERMTELEDDLTERGAVEPRRLEDSLTGIERMVNDALLSNSRTRVDAITQEIKQELKPYRSQMDPAVYEQTLNNLLLKRLRERLGIPRLSLFYL